MLTRKFLCKVMEMQLPPPNESTTISLQDLFDAPAIEPQRPSALWIIKDDNLNSLETLSKAVQLSKEGNRLKN